MDKVSLIKTLPAAVLVVTLAGCGTQTSSDAEAVADVAASQAATASRGPADVPPVPTAAVVDRLRAVGIDAVGAATKPAVGEVTLDAAVNAALASNGGLMADGMVPTSARFGPLKTPGFGETLDKGAVEKVVPALEDAHGWVLIYEDAVVPSAGGRGPQVEPREVPGSQAVPSARVDLAVVIDGESGEFLFARNL